VIPLGDNLGSQRRPIVTQVLIVACAVVFLFELTLRGAALDTFVQQWGAVPRTVLTALTGVASVPRLELITLFTSLFIHAGFLHLIGNLVFLWVFGRAVENRLGSPLFLFFYLLGGAIAGLVQCAVSGAGDTTPLIGASGAIAAVLGAYFISYPGAWVRVLLPVLFFFWAFDLPATLVLAFWFVSQFFSGMTAITRVSSTTSDVAFWAHIAGFLSGVVGALLLGVLVPPRIAARSSMPPGRADAPGPARLVSSIADLAALLLAARLVLRFVGSMLARTPLAALTAPILAVTDPLVAPIHLLVPDLRLPGGSIETASLVAIVLVYVTAGLVGQLFLGRSLSSGSRRPS
jgi:membrane associated rhomboid family serine protease